MRVRLHVYLKCVVMWLTLIALAGCQPTRDVSQQPDAAAVLQLLAEGEAPVFNDDLDVPSLKEALSRSLAFYGRLSPDAILPFGEEQVAVAVLKESLEHFSKILESHPEKLKDSSFVVREFDLYRTGDGRAKSLLVTGYYEPILPGRLKPSATYRHPIYRVPPDLVTVDLPQFGLQHCTERIVGRVVGNHVVPYFSRAEINGSGRLESYRLQLAWLEDPISVFFLHIQGSGVIELEDGERLRVGYAGTNGRQYRSIGKYLLGMGAIAAQEMSLQAIRKYLQEHPERVDEVLNYNESYVFFRPLADGPLGSLGFGITAGRSIATDQHCFPKGALAFLVSEKPRLDGNGNQIGWEPLRRWVLNQDTGSGVRGPKRMDVFCGTGKPAEALAGPMKQPGECFFLLKKGSRIDAKTEH
ncbi:MAG TPA: transglycosylase [Syntrophobacteraceae bacterium]|nr:transglycosylase [Syntrophobacteraceae bacterium]